MAKVTSFSNYLIIYSYKIYLYQPAISQRVLNCVDVSVLLQKEILKNGEHVVDTLRVSPCGQYLASTIGKELILVSFPDCKALSSSTIEKTASSLQFFHKLEKLLVADRTGSVTFFQYCNGSLQKEGLVLGHNSMLTDALISPSDKYVITSDRDEKIRISHFPNVYNIARFCLGHEMFVSSICVIPTSPGLLLSASGDGTLRIWDYVQGVQLTKFTIDVNEADGAIVKIVCRVVEGETQVAVQRHKTADIVLLLITGTIESGINIKMKEKIPTGENVIDITFSNSHLFYLVNQQNDMLRVWPETNKETINGISKNLTDEISLKNLDEYNVFFKRSVDNVQEYRERKKARLMQK